MNKEKYKDLRKDAEGNLIGTCNFCHEQDVSVVTHLCKKVGVIAENLAENKTIFDNIGEAKYRRNEIRKLLKNKVSTGSLIKPILIDKEDFNALMEHINNLGILLDEIGEETEEIINRVYLRDE